MFKLDIKPSIYEAIQKKQAIVALESTIITHGNETTNLVTLKYIIRIGMEYPQKKETALAVENIVKINGALPATIAIINGTVKIGLSEEEIDYLAKEGKSCKKCSRR